MKANTLFFSVILVSFLCANTNASENLQKCSLDKTFKVAVAQAGEFGDFNKMFYQMTSALITEGYLSENINLPKNLRIHKDFLEIAKASKGGCIEFLEDGLYDGQWDDTNTKNTFTALKERIKDKKDVDLVWAFGTGAGLNFADSSIGTNVMVITATDPESSGIIGKGEFSNKEHVHVQKEKDRYRSELVTFHDFFNFKNLGLIIDESPVQQLAQAVKVVDEVASENNFNVIKCEGPIFSEASENKLDTLSRCVLELKDKIDALYLPVGFAVNDDFYQSIEPLIKNEIPTFSQHGDSQVQRGMLLSLSDSEMVNSGRFEANVTKQIYNGIKPHEISQYYYAPLYFALNLQTAKDINWNPSFKVLVSVDKIFQQTIKNSNGN